MKTRIFVISEELGGSLTLKELNEAVDALCKKHLKSNHILHEVYIDIQGLYDGEYDDNRTIQVSIYREELLEETVTRLKREQQWEEQRKENERKSAKLQRDREKAEYLRLKAKFER